MPEEMEVMETETKAEIISVLCVHLERSVL